MSNPRLKRGELTGVGEEADSLAVRTSSRHRKPVAVLNIEEGIRSRAREKRHRRSEDEKDNESSLSKDSQVDPPAKKRKKGRPASNEEVFERARTIPRLIPIEKEDGIRKKYEKKYATTLLYTKDTEPGKGINTMTALFNRNFRRGLLDLLVFKECYGHTIVPKYYADNPFLGRFVAKMRTLRNKRDPRMTPERRKKLDEVGFVWNAKASFDFWKAQSSTKERKESWENMFSLLMEYKKEHGDCNVPKIYPPNQVSRPIGSTFHLLRPFLTFGVVPLQLGFQTATLLPSEGERR